MHETVGRGEARLYAFLCNINFDTSRCFVRMHWTFLPQLSMGQRMGARLTPCVTVSCLL